MIEVKILEDTDIIQPEDWCRPLQITTDSDGYSDHVYFNSCYSGRPQNNAKWVKVKYVIGEVWWGTSIGTFHKKIDSEGYEFLRGDVPSSHALKHKLRSLYSVTHAEDEIPF